MDEVLNGYVIGSPDIQGFLETGSSVVPGKVNNALHVDGVGQGVLLTGDAIENSPLTHPELGDFTIIMWLRHEGPTDTSDGKMCIEILPNVFRISGIQNELRMFFVADFWNLPAANLHTWYHIALV